MTEQTAIHRINTLSKIQKYPMTAVTHRKFDAENVESVFKNYAGNMQDRLLKVRELIFDIAEKNSEIGKIEETLKWGNPSYLTGNPKSGTTIRLSGLESIEHKYAISVHCQTTLISEFKEVFSDLEFDGNRSVILDTRKKFPTSAVEQFVFLALTYHYRKKLGV